MKCPACDRELKELAVGRLKVDACEGGCGGLWFDNFELKKVDQPHEFAGAILQEIRRDERVQVDMERRRKCPRCGDVVMMRHYFSPKRRVEIDTCPNCGGVWLDAGELGQIRQEFWAEPDREEMARAYFASFFDEDRRRRREEL